MSLDEAEATAGTLTKTTTMPGYSYGLDAHRRQRGAQLRNVPGSVCSDCYALKGFYPHVNVQDSQAHRHASLRRPLWVDAMATLIAHYCQPDDRGRRFFRWHDAGDIQGVWHLRRIVRVCEQTPLVRHWLPTHEHDHVAAFLRAGGVFPENLVVRLSEDMMNTAPDLPTELQELPTSTVQTQPRRAGNPVKRSGSIVCPAVDEKRSACDDFGCRACWDPRKRNVSYLRH